jgi:hypothetical protein
MTRIGSEVVDVEARIFFESEAVQFRGSGKSALDSGPQPDQDILGGRDPLAFGKFGKRVVQMLMVQAFRHFTPQQLIETGEVDAEAGAGIDVPAHGHFEEVVMTVADRVGAGAENAAILLF